jgi:nucleotide-binding universal stress UspA family protein
MAYQDILVHVDASEAGHARLRLAADLARRHGARLSALHVREYSIAQQHQLRSAELGLASSQRTDALTRDIDSALDRDADALRAQLAQLQRTLSLDTAWHALEGAAHKIVSQRARYADLTVVGYDPCENAALPDDYSFAETMLFTIGRPLLIVPSGESATLAATLGERIAIAWNGSRASARALSDALPLVQQAKHTTVLVAAPDRFAHPERVDPASVLDHVKRHTAHAHYCALPETEGSVGDALQDAALACGADMLVCGAHGRARLWEKMLGSVTRDLFARMRLPVLMSY